MEIHLTPEQEAFIQEKVRTGRYLDASDVVRDALRSFERNDDFISPELEATLLKAVEGPHEPYGPHILEEIRRNATVQK